MFSMAVLAFMTSVALEMVAAVAKVFWGTSLISAFTPIDLSTGISSQALQQGGMGLILTTLILTAPPMAAMFFQGTLGTFAPYATMGAHLSGAGGAPGGSPQNVRGGRSLPGFRITKPKTAIFNSMVVLVVGVWLV